MSSLKTDYLIYAIFLESPELQISPGDEFPDFIYTKNEHKRLYVGVTNDFKGRMGEHRKNSLQIKNKTKLYNCLRFYDFDNFTKIIIQSGLTREDSREAEKYWVKKLDTYKNGLNSTEGGDGGATSFGVDHYSSYPINMMNMTTKEILYFDWVGEAAEYLDVETHNIYQIFRDNNSSRQTFSKKQDAWFTAKRIGDETDWDYDMIPQAEELKKPIIMMNIDTRIPIHFKGITDAAKHFNINQPRLSTVMANTGRHNQLYIGDDIYDIQYDPPTRAWGFDIPPKKFAVIAFDQDDTDENPVYRFDSATDAAKYTGICRGHISSCACHDRWYTGKLNDRRLRWEFEDIEKRKAQKIRKEQKYIRK